MQQIRKQPTPVRILQENVRNMLKSVPMKENKETTCTPCEQNFEHKIDELVKEGKAPTTGERAKKRPKSKPLSPNTAKTGSSRRRGTGACVSNTQAPVCQNIRPGKRQNP